MTKIKGVCGEGVMTRFKNFDEWRAKKQFSETMAADLKMYDENDSKVDMRGFIYPDGAWIELKDSGQWHTIVGNTEEFFYDLRRMEDYLWSVHSSSNISTVREIMCDELEDFCHKNDLSKLSADELLHETMVRKQRTSDLYDKYEAQEAWLTDYIKRWDAIDDED